MANEEHVERLLRSIDEWNEWREEHPEIQPDLSGANLYDAKLSISSSRPDPPPSRMMRTVIYANEADLSETDLSGANLEDASLSNIDFSGANLSGADLNCANLDGARLIEVNLRGANLGSTSLRGTDFINANLSGVNLGGAILDGAILRGADLTNTCFWSTFFAWVDLSNVKGLGTAEHLAPSSVDINSVKLPLDEPIRLHFLRGVGFTETQIEYLPSLLTPRPIQYHSLFISFAHQDKIIAERLHTDFRKHDIPCWFAPHELIPGDYYRHKIDEAIRVHDKLVLILSQHSIKSDWVQEEVETALKREESMDMDQQVLFPIRLDDTAMTTSRRWISSLRYHRHIGDFTNWQDETAYQQAFTTLLRHLKVPKQ